VFAAERLKVRPSELTLEQLDAGLVSAFLEHLEDARPIPSRVMASAIGRYCIWRSALVCACPS
jgi:hypothetical protein